MKVSGMPTSDPEYQRAYRQRTYNATVTWRHEVHAELFLLRVRTDGAPLCFDPGQYTTLGLAAWEPCEPRSAPFAVVSGGAHELLRRAYSFSCRVLDDRGQLVPVGREAELEFYITLVRGTESHVPGLTPRLFALQVGDRLQVGLHPKGHYGLAPVRDDDDVVFAATGTGEAPHNTMITELLRRGHRGRILSVVGVRYANDLAYVPIHRALEQRHPQFRYVTLTTREPRNLDATRADYVGKEYVQQFFAGGGWDEAWQHHIDAQRTQVFVCGNPQMIGLPSVAADGTHVYPQPPGLIEVLESRGFRADRAHQVGNVHYEKYW